MPKPDLTLVAGGRPRGPTRRLPTGDLRGLYRMRRLIEPELSAQSCLLLPSAELDLLAAHIPFGAPSSDHVIAAHRAFHLALILPAASLWDLRVLRPLWAETDGIALLAMGRDGAPSAEVIRSSCACAELIAAYKTGDPDAARAAALGYLERSERLVRELCRAVG